MDRFGAALELSGRGDRAAARDAFAQLWHEIGDNGDALHRCAVAHAMADVQDDVQDQIAWDLRALRAADAVTDAMAEGAGVPVPVRGLYPSLHLNLADAYLRAGDRDAARGHLLLGRTFLRALPDDGYRTTIADALDRVEAALES